MTRLSAQLSGIVTGVDDGWGVLYRAREMERRGEDVAMLAMGDHDFPTPAPIREACKDALDSGRTGYASVSGILPLRREIAKRVPRAHGIEIHEDDVTLAVGGQSGLFACCAAALDPGDEAIIIEPYYATYDQTVRAVGGVAVIVGTDPDAGFQPDPAAIEAAITPRTRMILINTPNNPSGAVYSRETLEGIAELCARHDLWLVSDEVYHSQVYDGAHLSPASLPGMRARCFIVDSMSKSHAMTGWRAGWVISPDAAIAAKLADFYLTCSYGLPPFIQLAMRAGLALGIEPEHEIAARYRLRRDLAVRALKKSTRIRVTAPAAAMYVLADIRGLDVDAEEFAYALLAETGVAAMPGDSFGRATRGHLRLSLTAPDEKLVAACEALAAFADGWTQT